MGLYFTTLYLCYKFFFYQILTHDVEFVIHSSDFFFIAFIKKVDEEPNKNYFGLRYLIPAYVNAWWELIRSFIMDSMYGTEYMEGWLSVVLRVVGLILPGISAHNPTNYVNSIRLGRMNAMEISSL